MAWMEVLAPAKLNLYLELIERRSDGFHEIETIMTSVSLFDRVLLRRRSDDRILLSQAVSPHSSREVFSMPEDNSNLAWQAIDLLASQSGQRFGVDVCIQKNIPNQAGLGGGSSDAAATLVGVNRVFGLGRTRKQLNAIGAELGSDVAFFVGGYCDQSKESVEEAVQEKKEEKHSRYRTAVCTGRGEQIRSLPGSPFHFVVAMPPTGLSTAEVYRHSQVSDRQTSSNVLQAGLRSGSVRQVAQGICNRLQSSAEKLSDWISRLRDEFHLAGSAAHQMTGSGSAYFGLFESRAKAIRAARRIFARLPDCSVFSVRSVGNEANFIRYRAE